jgi:hypothetical protein
MVPHRPQEGVEVSASARSGPVGEATCRDLPKARSVRSDPPRNRRARRAWTSPSRREPGPFRVVRLSGRPRRGAPAGDTAAAVRAAAAEALATVSEDPAAALQPYLAEPHRAVRFDRKTRALSLAPRKGAQGSQARHPPVFEGAAEPHGARQAKLEPGRPHSGWGFASSATMSGGWRSGPRGRVS